MPINRLLVKEKVYTYAEMLLLSVYEAGGKEAVSEARNQMSTIIRYMRSSTDFISAIDDVNYTPEQHSSLIRNVFVGFNPLVLDVIGVMAERNDMRLLPRVYRAFEEQLEEKYNIVVVDVTTTVELDEGLRKTIKDKVSADLGREIMLRERIDASILGGIIMSANGKRIDASVRAQLDSARSVLKTTKTEVNSD